MVKLAEMATVLAIYLYRSVPTVPLVDFSIHVFPSLSSTSSPLNGAFSLSLLRRGKRWKQLRWLVGQMRHGAPGGSGIDVLCDIIGMRRSLSCFAERLGFPNHSTKALAGCAHSQPDRPVCPA